MLLLFADIFQGRHEAHPIKVVLLLLHHVLQGAVKKSRVVEAPLDEELAGRFVTIDREWEQVAGNHDGFSLIKRLSDRVICGEIYVPVWILLLCLIHLSLGYHRPVHLTSGSSLLRLENPRLEAHIAGLSSVSLSALRV